MKTSCVLPFVCAAFLCAAPLVHAQSNNEVLFILDSSGSMKASLKGESKMDSARKALRAALGELQPGTRVGLRLYSHRVPQSKKEESCRDTELAIPFQPLNPARFNEVLNSINPLGYTPISYALEQARTDFPVETEAQRTIILLSDGEETCGGDPKATAEALLRDGFKVRIHTIGFDVNEVAEKELRAVATATGGKYFSASDAKELGAALKSAAAEAAVIQKTKSLYGEAVRGGDSFESAVPLQFDKELKLDHHQKATDYDYFWFEGKAGDEINIKVRTLEMGIAIDKNGAAHENRSPYIRVALHGEDRTSLSSLSTSGTFSGREDRTVLKRDGRHFLLVGGGASMHMDGATFIVSRITFGDGGTPNDAGGDIESALPIQPGRYPANYFSSDKDADVYSFEATAGEEYFVAIIPPPNSGIGVRVSVTDEYGDVLLKESLSSGKTKPFMIKSDGRYFIQLTACCFSDKVLKYLLDLKRLPKNEPEPEGPSPTAASSDSEEE